MIGMRYMIRTVLFICTIMLGWMNMPAQAFLAPDDQQNLWPVMSQKFDISQADIDKTDVREQIDWDLRNPKYIHRLTENAKPYLYYVYQETKKYHLPPEIALLPMIESGYVPDGRSRAGAVGLWQLMPGTANNFGVKMNYFYDGRQSITVSTKVALHFLSYLYQEFNHNWLLALAAYNAGPGTVIEAIRYNREHGRPTDFWALPLPRETENYVPKLLALATIIQHPHAYGMRLAPVPDKAVTSTVRINNEMKIKTIAKLAQTSVTTVEKLNPALKRSETPPHQSVTLVLPVTHKQTFEKQLQVHKEIKKEIAENHLARYKVKHGDSLSAIALKFKTTIHEIEKLNQLHNGMIRINQALLVPRMFAVAEQQDHGHTTQKHTTHNEYYTVKRGDDLWGIAKRFGVSHQALLAMNHISPYTPLRVGEKLVVRQQQHHIASKKPHQAKIIFSQKAKKNIARSEHIYIVKPGDNLHRLAAEFHTTTYHIMQHNHLRTANLSIGERLQLPNA